MTQVFHSNSTDVVRDPALRPGVADPFAAAAASAKSKPSAVPLALWVFDSPKQESPVEPSGFPCEELASVENYINHIVHKHHHYSRSALEALAPLVSQVAIDKGPQYPEFKALETLFRHFKQDVLTHLCQEESVIFPACVAMETQGTVPVVFQGRFTNPLSLMQSDHGATADMLGQLHHLLATVVEPEDMCETYCTMRDGLWHFLEDLAIHLYKEDQILFPRVWNLRERLL